MSDDSLMTTADVEAIIAKLERHWDMEAADELHRLATSETAPGHVKLRAVDACLSIVLKGKAGPRPDGWDDLFAERDAAIDTKKGQD